VNYRVIEAGDPDELRQRVMGTLLDGWRLQGGVMIVAVGDDNYLYAQAVIREPTTTTNQQERG
jgi:hypothetical protein